MNQQRTHALLRSLVWLGAFAWWAYLEKPTGASVLQIQSGVAGVLGLGLIVAGSILFTWRVVTLARGVTTALTPPAELLMRGPYEYVRNPLYLAAAAVLAGIATLYAAWSPTDFVAAAVLAVLVHIAVVRIEEPATRKRLGPAYDEYCRRVGRWLPRLMTVQGTKT